MSGGKVTLYAPRVDAVQPAFIYGSTKIVKIYFDYGFTEVNFVTKIAYTIVDPNVISTWGNNSMIKNGLKYKTISTVATEDDGRKYIELDLSSNSDYKTLTLNQYYQIQLYFCGENFDDSKSLDVNAGYRSEPSQTTLIRPISAPVITFDESDPYILAGSLPENTKEFFESYWCTGNGKSTETYTGKGRTFSIPLDKLELEEGSVYNDIKLHYITTHGYKGEESVTKTFAAIADFDNIHNVSVNAYPACGGVKIDFTLTETDNAIVKIQRKQSNEVQWKTILTKTCPIPGAYGCYVFLQETGIANEYRLLVYSASGDLQGKKIVPSCSVNFEDILLSNKDILIPIKYNSQISSFKWVTQESVINTLGGKYPIISKNGDSKYRQFSLSGTIYANITTIEDINTTSPQVLGDSDIKSIFFMDDALRFESNLYFASEDSLPKMTTNQRKNEIILRNYIIDFLTDGGVKLFRAEEGNMLIHLSNISFTPNEQLGRLVYNFSATVTEVCECNEENLNKYGLQLTELRPLVMKVPVQSDNDSIFSSGHSFNGVRDSLRRDV